MPENISLPGYSSDDPNHVLTPEVMVADTCVNYFVEGLEFADASGTSEVIFEINVDWMMKVVGDEDASVLWCSVNPPSGSAGIQKVKVNVAQNNSYDPRSARIVLMSDTNIVSEIAVLQACMNAILLNQTKDSVSHDASSITVEVKSNIDVDYEILDADWINGPKESTRGLNTHSFKFDVEKNSTYEIREARICFYNKDYEVADTLIIYQEGSPIPVVTVPVGADNYFVEGLKFAYIAASSEVVFDINVDWAMQIIGSDGTPVSWCSVEPSSGNAGLQKVQVSVTDNDSYDSRIAKIVLKSDTCNVSEIAVEQAYENVILLDRMQDSISHVSTSITIEVKSSVAVEYEILDADWIRESKTTTRGLSTFSYVFDVDENPTYDSREARIRFYNVEHNLETVMCIIQSGSEPLVIEAIDLGLSVKWASCNVGASSPEEYGGYYAWGETIEKDKYRWGTYEWCEGVENSLIKYCIKSDYGTVDNKLILAPEDDVAQVQWGEKWRMPTSTEVKELKENCSWEWTKINSVSGYKITGPNSNSIFLPAAGYISESEIYRIDSYGYYWSRTVDMSDNNFAYILFFNSNYYDLISSIRYYGRTVRPVWNDSQSTSVIVTTDDASHITNSKVTLSGTVTNVESSVTCGIIYGESSTLSSTSGTMKSTTSNGDFSITLSGLTAGTTYYYCAYVIDEGEYKYGDVCSFKTKSPVIGDAIDFGLSVKWASCNVGASSPEDYGGYYAWGETDEKNDYSWATYKWCNGSQTSLTKYCTDSSYGIVDNKTTLDLGDDVAQVKWGNGWRMSTKDEMNELVNKCSWQWTTLNGVNGCTVTGPNGNSIFLPASGDDSRVTVSYAYGKYWSGTPSSEYENYVA